MTIKIFKSDSDAFRCAIESYANRETLKIHKMSPEQRKQSIDQLHTECFLSSNFPEMEKEALFNFGITWEELTLRAAFQKKFELLPADVLQSHFTHFYNQGRKFTQQLETDPEATIWIVSNKANKLIVDELYKSMQKKGSVPQVPSEAVEQKV